MPLNLFFNRRHLVLGDVEMGLLIHNACVMIVALLGATRLQAGTVDQHKQPHTGEAKTAAGTKQPDAPLVAQMKKKLASMRLPPEVLAKATGIVDEYGPKYVAAQQRRQSVLTAEQRAIQTATAKANREADKQGRDVLDGIQEAIKLTLEQKARWDAAEKEKNAVGAKLYESLRGILTEEQQMAFGVPKQGASAYAN